MKKLLILTFCMMTTCCFADQWNEFDNLLYDVSTLETYGQELSQNRATLESTSVQVVYLGGYNFHVADYVGGIRVVTGLDGDIEGLQRCARNGVLFAESWNFHKHKHHVTHYYPDGTVETHKTKQILKLK